MILSKNPDTSRRKLFERQQTDLFRETIRYTFNRIFYNAGICPRAYENCAGAKNAERFNERCSQKDRYCECASNFPGGVNPNGK